MGMTGGGNGSESSIWESVATHVQRSKVAFAKTRFEDDYVPVERETSDT
jgi:hypothetical protein